MRTKVVSFFIFFQELSNKKKIKALRPKMTKIASRGGGGPALTLSRASMGKSTVYGRWGLRHLNFVFICRMATRLRKELRIELFFTVIKSFWGVHIEVLAEIFAQR